MAQGLSPLLISLVAPRNSTLNSSRVASTVQCAHLLPKSDRLNRPVQDNAEMQRLHSLQPQLLLIAIRLASFQSTCMSLRSKVHQNSTFAWPGMHHTCEQLEAICTCYISTSRSINLYSLSLGLVRGVYRQQLGK